MALIRDRGLQPEMVRIIPGAAGGPKWIVLNQLDRAIFGEWLPKNSSESIHLVGASAGAWRFAAATQKNPEAAIDRLEKAYIEQRYPSKPTAGDVTLESEKIVDALLGKTGSEEILAHPFLRLNILAVRSRPIVRSDSRLPLMLGLAASALANLLHRSQIRWFYQRTLLHHPAGRLPLAEERAFATRAVPLQQNNIKAALMASGAIPLIMKGIPGIPGAPPGVYRDGGIIDYHLDLPFRPKTPGIVLYPHFIDRIIPGWFDKHLSWRRATADNLADMLLISPTPDFIKSLPNQKIPDREDFKHYFQRDDDRIAAWYTVARQSRQLAEAFLEVCNSGKIAELLQQLD